MPKGRKIWPYQMKHCLCCINANWFRQDPDSDYTDDMTVRCRYFPNEDKFVGIGAKCSHFASMFIILKDTQPNLVGF